MNMSKFNKIITKQKQERQQKIEQPDLNQPNILGDTDLSPVQRRAVAGSQHGTTMKRISIDLIDPSPYQPRFMSAMEPEELQELADNIRQNGQINPILVRPKNGRYELIGGERRLKAIADILKLNDIDCLVKDISDEKAALTALVDNINRTDLTDFEIAHSLKKNCEQFGYPIDKVEFITEKFNISRNKYYRLISLFDIPDFIIQDLSKEPQLLSGSGASLLKTALNKVTEMLGLSQASALLQQHWQIYVSAFQIDQRRHTQFIKDFEKQAQESFENSDLSNAIQDADEETQQLVDQAENSDQHSIKANQTQHSLLNSKGKKFGSLKCSESLKGNKVLSIRFSVKDMSEEKLEKLKNFLAELD